MCVAKDLDYTGSTPPFSVGKCFALHKMKSTPYEEFSLISHLSIHEVDSLRLSSIYCCGGEGTVGQIVGQMFTLPFIF